MVKSPIHSVKLFLNNNRFNQGGRLLFIAVISTLAGFANAASDIQNAGGWVKYQNNPVLGGKYGTCFDISVLKDGEPYRMWFSWRPKASVALVESKDGFHWSEPVIVLRSEEHTSELQSRFGISYAV